MKQNNLGGTRQNAGRPKGEAKKAIGKRVPIKYHKKLVALIEQELVKLKTQ